MASAPAATAARAQSQFPAGERSSVMEVEEEAGGCGDRLGKIRCMCNSLGFMVFST